MPGLAVKGHVLSHITDPVDEQMGRNTEMADIGKIGMGLRVQAITEKFIDMTPAKFAWWQTDVVNHQQADFRIGRALTLVRGCHLSRWD